MTEWTEGKLSNCTPSAAENIKNTIAKYGDNKWWELEDKSEMAKWQIFECILMVDWSSFQEGIETLLGHHVFTHEFVTMRRELQEEVKALCVDEVNLNVKYNNGYKNR